MSKIVFILPLIAFSTFALAKSSTKSNGVCVLKDPSVTDQNTSLDINIDRWQYQHDSTRKIHRATCNVQYKVSSKVPITITVESVSSTTQAKHDGDVQLTTKIWFQAEKGTGIAKIKVPSGDSGSLSSKASITSKCSIEPAVNFTLAMRSKGLKKGDTWSVGKTSFKIKKNACQP